MPTHSERYSAGPDRRSPSLATLTPGFFRPVPVPADAPPTLAVVVDTEEEFDWAAPFSRASVGVTAIEEVGRLQDVLTPRGFTPTYVIDYPVATTPSSVRRLGDLARTGACEIGAHLHPWVNPPYDEPLEPRASFACNLGLDLEMDKLVHLKEAIVEHFALEPRVYKAGRYAFGPTTAEVLEWLDFDVDASVIPHMDFSSQHGPSFEGFSPALGSFGTRRRLLEMPCTTGFVGTARRIGPSLHRAASARWLEPLHAIGVLARSGTLNKVMISPEGNTLAEMRALTATLYREGLRTFALTFHSPSLKPGCTPYVHTTGERDAFVKAIDQYCAYFVNEFGGVPTTPARLYDEWKDRL